MKDQIFIGWSGTNNVALEIKKRLEAKIIGVISEEMRITVRSFRLSEIRSYSKSKIAIKP